MQSERVWYGLLGTIATIAFVATVAGVGYAVWWAWNSLGEVLADWWLSAVIIFVIPTSIYLIGYALQRFDKDSTYNKNKRTKAREAANKTTDVEPSVMLHPYLNDRS